MAETKRHTISHADELYHGKVFYSKYTPDGRRGVKLSHMVWHDFGAPDTLDADALVDAATSTELPNNETVTYTMATDGGTSPIDGAASDGVLDVPRNITASTTHATSVVAMTITVTGLDVYGETMVEDIAVAAGGTSQSDAGTKAFKSVTSVAIQSSGNAESNTLDVGFGDVLGLPFRIDNSTDVVVASAGGTAETATIVVADTTSPATATDGDVRGTIDFNTAMDGSTRVGALLVLDDFSSKEAVFGVDQYGG